MPVETWLGDEYSSGQCERRLVGHREHAPGDPARSHVIWAALR
jgi:hypothetical protein